MNGFPTRDRRAVEHDAFTEGILFDGCDVGGHVLPFAARIRETEIDKLHFVIFDKLQDVFGRLHLNTYPFLKIR